MDETSTDASPQPADSRIDHAAAITYWSAIDATLDGVLGGYPQVSRIDLKGSRNFLAKLRRQSNHFPPGKPLRLAVDCGAGIGRITRGLLVKVCEQVDIVEPIRKFTDKVSSTPGVGEIYNVGLEDWRPDEDGLGPYDLIWNQWCLTQLTDRQLVEYLKRLPAVLSEGGWIVVKENVMRSAFDYPQFDETDNTVTRTDAGFRAGFREAGLEVVRTELQRGLPRELYPLRTYALQPKAPREAC